MAKRTDDEIIAYILDECAKGGIRDIYSLIKEFIEYTDDDYVEVHLTHIRIMSAIKAGNLASITKDGHRISANANTRDIIEKGGYTLYRTIAENRAKLKETGDDAKSKYDIFLLKIRWLPYIISGLALAISILALLQSIGVLHWFGRNICPYE